MFRQPEAASSSSSSSAAITISSTSRMGGWEDYTRGMGSKLMEQMGYVHGTGLGKEGRQGRVDPVMAYVYPQGKKKKSKSPPPVQVVMRSNLGGCREDISQCLVGCFLSYQLLIILIGHS